LKAGWRKRFADFVGAADRKTAVALLAATALECVVLKASTLQRLSSTQKDEKKDLPSQFATLPDDGKLEQDLDGTMHAVDQIAYLDQRTGSDVPAQLRQAYSGLPSAFDYLLTYAQAERKRNARFRELAEERKGSDDTEVEPALWVSSVEQAYDSLSTSSSCQFRLPSKEEKASRVLSAKIPIGGKIELGFLGDVYADAIGSGEVGPTGIRSAGQTRLTFSSSLRPHTSTWLLRDIDNGRTQSLEIETVRPEFCSSLREALASKVRAIQAALKPAANYCDVSPP
jgi:hypothetical protein